jgi:hypothetical protein
MLDNTPENDDRLSEVPPIAVNSLAELEEKFLQARVIAMNDYLSQNLADWEDQSDGRKPLSWTRALQLEPARCEAEMLESLLHDPSRQEFRLEEILADQLSHLDNQLAQLTATHEYDETYWQTETTHQVATKILRDWWHWLKLEH